MLNKLLSSVLSSISEELALKHFDFAGLKVI